MNIQLDWQMEAILSRLVSSGAYASKSDALAAAIQLLDAEAKRRRKHEELWNLVREGIASADRGELDDGEEVFEELLRELDGHSGSSGSP